MMISDNIFGQLEYDFGWSRYMKMDFCGKTEEIVLMVSGEEDEDFEQGQYDAYENFKNKWQSIQNNVLGPILEYYKKRRQELGYDIENNPNYPEILSTEVLLQYINLTGIKVPYAEFYGGRSIGLCFNCKWDEENGLGVRLSDEQVVRVGYQHVAI